MVKINHNKYKNSGILFELLTRQIASDVISGNDSPAINIVKKYYGKKTELSKEYKLYSTLVNSKLNESKADLFINTVIDLSVKLNRTLIRNEKYNLIKEIKEHYNIEEFFKAKINNYKQYASIYNLIEVKNCNEFVEPSFIIDNKVTLLEHISNKTVNKEEVKDRVLEEYLKLDAGTRVLAYKILLEKFNSKYNSLSSYQKLILREFINNISNTVKLREFINEQYSKIKTELIKLSKGVDDSVTKIKLNEVVSLIKPFEKNQNIKDDDMVTLMQYCQLINELKIVK